MGLTAIWTRQRIWKWKRCENPSSSRDARGREGCVGNDTQKKATNLISSFIVHEVDDDSLRLLLSLAGRVSKHYKFANLVLEKKWQREKKFVNKLMRLLPWRVGWREQKANSKRILHVVRLCRLLTTRFQVPMTTNNIYGSGMLAARIFPQPAHSVLQFKFIMIFSRFARVASKIKK